MTPTGVTAPTGLTVRAVINKPGQAWAGVGLAEGLVVGWVERSDALFGSPDASGGGKLSMACAKPAAANTTAAPGRAMARASASSPGRLSASSRSSAMARAPRSRSCSIASA